MLLLKRYFPINEDLNHRTFSALMVHSINQDLYRRTFSSLKGISLSMRILIKELFQTQVGGMRVVTKPRVSESEKPAEKPKEEGDEVNNCTGQ